MNNPSGRAMRNGRGRNAVGCRRRAGISRRAPGVNKSAARHSGCLATADAADSYDDETGTCSGKDAPTALPLAPDGATGSRNTLPPRVSCSNIAI